MENECLDSEENNHALKIIVKHQNQLSIKLIIAKNKNKFQNFRFRETNIAEIKSILKILIPKKHFK